MKDKRRRKAKKEWAEFQIQYQLTDEDIKRAHGTGYPLKHFQNLLGTDDSGSEISKSQRIEEFYRQWTERVAKRRAEIEAGVIVPKAKKPAKSSLHDPKWAEAKQVCRLNMDDIRKAKELGFSPQTLIKNVPDQSQKWKAPVKVWIQDLYEARFGASGKSKSFDSIAGDSHQGTEPISAMPRNSESEISHDGIVRDWEENAERNREESYLFLRSLKFNDYGFDVDKAANELHQTAFQTVDCTRCANCCKTTTPKFDQSDVNRVAAFLEMPPTEFIARYLEPKPNELTYNTRQTPCPLLGEDNRCTVYEVRPTVCREYPYTDKEGIVFRTMGVANNTTICPAVFWIVEKLKERVRKRN